MNETDKSTILEKFSPSNIQLARKIVNKVFRWQPPVGTTYQGFMKVLRKWHVELKLAITPYVQTQMKEVLPGQWQIAGYVVFAGDGSRVELARTDSLEATFSPNPSRKRGRKRRTGSSCRRPR